MSSDESCGQNGFHTSDQLSYSPVHVLIGVAKLDESFLEDLRHAEMVEYCKSSNESALWAEHNRRTENVETGDMAILEWLNRTDSNVKDTDGSHVAMTTKEHLNGTDSNAKDSDDSYLTSEMISDDLSNGEIDDTYGNVKDICELINAVENSHHNTIHSDPQDTHENSRDACNGLTQVTSDSKERGVFNITSDLAVKDTCDSSEENTIDGKANLAVQNGCDSSEENTIDGRACLGVKDICDSLQGNISDEVCDIDIREICKSPKGNTFDQTYDLSVNDICVPSEGKLHDETGDMAVEEICDSSERNMVNGTADLVVNDVCDYCEGNTHGETGDEAVKIICDSMESKSVCETDDLMNICDSSGQSTQGKMDNVAAKDSCDSVQDNIDLLLGTGDLTVNNTCDISEEDPLSVAGESDIKDICDSVVGSTFDGIANLADSDIGDSVVESSCDETANFAGHDNCDSVVESIPNKTVDMTAEDICDSIIESTLDGTVDLAVSDSCDSVVESTLDGTLDLAIRDFCDSSGADTSVTGGMPVNDNHDSIEGGTTGEVINSLDFIDKFSDDKLHSNLDSKEVSGSRLTERHKGLNLEEPSSRFSENLKKEQISAELAENIDSPARDQPLRTEIKGQGDFSQSDTLMVICDMAQGEVSVCDSSKHSTPYTTDCHGSENKEDRPNEEIKVGRFVESEKSIESNCDYPKSINSEESHVSESAGLESVKNNDCDTECITEDNDNWSHTDTKGDPKQSNKEHTIPDGNNTQNKIQMLPKSDNRQNDKGTMSSQKNNTPNKFTLRAPGHSKVIINKDNDVQSIEKSNSEIDKIPKDLVKRLMQRFSQPVLENNYSQTQRNSEKHLGRTGKQSHSKFSKYQGEEKPAAAKVEKTTKEEKTTKKEETGSGTVTTVTTTKTTQEVVQNGDIASESKEKEEIRFDEMSSIKTKFESGQSETVTSPKPNFQDELMTVEGGVYENEPVKDPDVFRESDKHIGEELPEVGTAKNILEKFKQIQTEKSVPVTSASRKREPTPPESRGKGEYVSEPRAVLQTPEQKVEGGIFENQPQEEEGVVKSYEVLEDVKPEQGYARNVLAKFKEIESQTVNQPPPSPKKELTPDRFTKGEYVSEPRTVFEKYENKVESGIYESQPTDAEDIVKSGQHVEEVMPERGTAKNLVSRFKQYEKESASPPSPHQKREITPDRFTKGEYVSEPRATMEKYEGQPEAGIFESKPSDREDIVKSGEFTEEPLPEQGYTKNILSKFREIQSGSPPSTTPRKVKEVTPPREDMFSGVLENKPTESPDVVKSYDRIETEAELPESGMARNLVSKFREIQTGTQSQTSPRQKKEFTPPPQSGVYENTPQQSIVVEQRKPESGILESNPDRREDIAREKDYSTGDVEFPESGYAKNMVSKWRQIESESAKSSTPSPRYKEFTPPRVEPNIASARSPLSPKSPAGTNSSVHPHDLPGQYQEQVQPGIYENQPENRDDLAKEEDTDWSVGLPKEGTSRSLISKFKNVQEEAKKAQVTPKPISRKDSTDESKSPAPNTKKQMFEVKNEVNDGDEDRPSSNGTTADDAQDVKGSDGEPKSAFVAVQLEKCAACQKTVYAMEKVEMNKNSYHKTCFKCSHCNTRLTAKTFSMNEGIMFCTNHFKQLFTRKGNYDEGFGRQQHKKRWQGDKPPQDQQNASDPSA